MKSYFIEDKGLKDNGFYINYDPEKKNLVGILVSLLKKNGRKEGYFAKGLFIRYGILGLYMEERELERSKATKKIDKIRKIIRRHLRDNDVRLEKRVLKGLNGNSNGSKRVYGFRNPLVNRKLSVDYMS
ncbi:hypothetical protein HY498_03305 [Candidatus Woesearchaeota archaeon]|nr:hypothetical protein [Candidatus Woesearchaeota archaeon]